MVRGELGGMAPSAIARSPADQGLDDDKVGVGASASTEIDHADISTSSGALCNSTASTRCYAVDDRDVDVSGFMGSFAPHARPLNAVGS